MALLTAQAGAALLWFLYPRFKAGTFGGVFELDVSEVPPLDAAPKPYAGGRFWLVNVGPTRSTDPREKSQRQAPGVKALYMICVHLGCLYSWVGPNDRFECPCHGSKYLATGHRVEGPATRNLDVFVIEAVDANGQVVATTEATAADGTEGNALSLEGVAKLRINTGKRINGGVFPL